MLPALISAAPALIGLFTKGGSTAEKVAGAASEVARVVTGRGSDDEAMAALKADPALMLEYQRQTAEQAIALYEQETRRLETVNATMRAEATSKDAYVRRWRPTFGYAVALTWAVLMIALSAAVILTPGDAPAIIASIASLAPHWGVALAVLGVAVHERSKDKETAAGVSRPGLLDAISERIAKR